MDHVQVPELQRELFRGQYNKPSHLNIYLGYKFIAQRRNHLNFSQYYRHCLVSFRGSRSLGTKYFQ